MKIVCYILAILLVGGVDAGGKCESRSNYNCGAKFPPDGNTCSGKGCCCDGENGHGLEYYTCTGVSGFTNRGCDSCWGSAACYDTENMNIGSNSCHGNNSCISTSHSTIFNDSCQGRYACNDLGHTTIGSGSCKGYYACKDCARTTIGSGSCNAKYICEDCAEYSIVPDNACNDQYGVDTRDKKCNYCMVCSMKKKNKCRFGFLCPSSLFLLSILTYISYDYSLLYDRAFILVPKLISKLKMVKFSFVH